MQLIPSLQPLTGDETNLWELLQAAFGCLMPKLTQYEHETRNILTFRISEVIFMYARRMLHTSLLSSYKNDHQISQCQGCVPQRSPYRKVQGQKMQKKTFRMSTNRLGRSRVIFVRLRVRKEIVTDIGAFNLANGNPPVNAVYTGILTAGLLTAGLRFMPTLLAQTVNSDSLRCASPEPIRHLQ